MNMQKNGFLPTFLPFFLSFFCILFSCTSEAQWRIQCNNNTYMHVNSYMHANPCPHVRCGCAQRATHRTMWTGGDAALQSWLGVLSTLKSWLQGCSSLFSAFFFQLANLQRQGVSIAIVETIDRSFVMREKETCIWLPFHFLSTLS